MNRKLTIVLLLTVVAMIGMPEVLAIDVENPVSVGGPNGVNIAPGTISVGGPSGVNIPTTTPSPPTMTEIPTITAAPTTAIVPPISAPAPAAAPSTNPFAAAFGAPSGEVARQRLEPARQACLANPSNPACTSAILSGIQAIRGQGAPVPAGPGGLCQLPDFVPFGSTGICVPRQ